MKVIKVKSLAGDTEFRATEDGKFICIADLSKNVKGGGAYYTISKILATEVDAEIRKSIDGNLYVDMDKLITYIEMHKELYPRTTRDYSATLRKALLDIVQNIHSVENQTLSALDHAEELVRILTLNSSFDSSAETKGLIARLEYDNLVKDKLINTYVHKIEVLEEELEMWRRVQTMVRRKYEIQE